MTITKRALRSMAGALVLLAAPGCGSSEVPSTTAASAPSITAPPPFPTLPTPGPSDPGPPEEAPPRASVDPAHSPPPIASLPGKLPVPSPDLEGLSTQTRPPAFITETRERAALLIDPTDTRDVDKRHAAVLLGLAGDSESLPSLHHALVLERNPSIRAQSARSLGRLGAPASLVPLWDALRDRDEGVRVAAALALGELGRPEAIPVLEVLAATGRGPEATAALVSLTRLDAREALALLDPGPAARHTAPGAGWSPSKGATIHVDATAGSDDGDGTEAAPFRTLSRGVLALRPAAGDRLLATSGAEHVPFREEVDVLPQAGGTPDTPTVLAAWPGRPVPVLDGELAGAPGQPGMRIGLHIGADYVRVEDFVVRHYADSGVDLSGSTGSALVRCVAEECGRHGLFVYYAPRSLIVEPAVRGSAAQGISIRTSPGTTVLGGITRDNGIDGLLLLQDSDDVVVHGLRATGNRRGLAITTGSNRARVVGAVLDGNDQALVIEPDSDAVVIDSGTPTQE